MDSVVLYPRPHMCGPSSRNQAHIFSVHAALEENFVDAVLTCRLETRMWSLRWKTKWQVQRCFQAARCWDVTEVTLKDTGPHEVSLVWPDTCKQHSGSAPPTGTKRQTSDLEQGNDELDEHIRFTFFQNNVDFYALTATDTTLDRTITLLAAGSIFCKHFSNSAGNV